MKLVWIDKGEQTVIRKVKIGDKVYQIKGISNIPKYNSIEKVIEIGEEYFCRKNGGV